MHLAHLTVFYLEYCPREGRGVNTNVLFFKERYMMAHGCKVMVRGRVWEEDVPPPVQSMKPKLLQSSKVHGGL